MLFIVALVVHGIPRGLPLSNDIADFFVDPVRLIHAWSYAWDPNVFLGQETGTSQAFLPAALFYAGLAYLHITGYLALRIYVSLIVLASFASAAALAYTLSPRLGLAPLAVIVSGAFYSLNLFVLSFLPTMPSSLWIYALLPLAVICAYKGISRREPLFWGVLAGCLTVVESGANGATLLISCVAWLLLTFFFSLEYAVDRPLRSFAALVTAAGVTAIALNSYWIVPLVEQLPRIWLGGVFSEGAAWHSTNGGIFDVLRFTNGYDLFGVDESGPYYAFGQGYQGVTFASVLSLALPIASLTAFMSRRVRRLKLARLLLLLLVAGIVMGSGAHPGAWLGSLWLYAYYHIPFFQIFRSITKWDIIIALCLALTLAVACTEAARALSSRMRYSKFNVVSVLLLCVAVGQAVFLSPILRRGIMPARQLVSVPAYWRSARSALHLAETSRVLVFPEAYLPKFFWGDVGSDFPAAYLERPTDYLIAGGTVAPSADTALATKGAYVGLRSNVDWAIPLLQRMDVGRILNARDYYYYTSEQGQSDPLTVTTELHQMRGLEQTGADGLIDSYTVPNPMHMTSVVQVLRSGVTGELLYPLFRLVGGDIALQQLCGCVARPEDGTAPLLLGPGGVLDAAVNATRPLGAYHGGAEYFFAGRDTDIDVFARDRFASGSPASFTISVDGKAVAVEGLPYWVLVASELVRPGMHVVSAPGAGSVEVAAVDDSALQASEVNLRRSARLARYFAGFRDGVRFWIPPGAYRIRTLAEPTLEPWEIPLKYELYKVAVALSSGASVPAFLSGAEYDETLQPPLPNWYASPSTWSLAVDGRVNVESFGTEASLMVFNPSPRRAAALIRGVFATLGDARSVTVLGPTGGASDVYLGGSPNLGEMLSQTPIAPPLFRFSGPFAQAELGVAIAPGWSVIPVLASPAFGLPNPQSSRERFLLWESLGNVSATINALGSQKPPRAASRRDGDPRESVSDVTIRAGPERTRIQSMLIHLPRVSFDTLPSVKIPVSYSDGGSWLHAWVLYDSSNTARFGRATVQQSSPAEYDILLRPDSTAASGAKVLSLLLVAEVFPGHMLALSAPTMELQQSASVVYSGAESPTRRGSELILPGVADPGLVKLAVPVDIAEPDRSDAELNLSGGLAVGRVVPLPVPTVSQLSSRAQQFVFDLPLRLSVAQRELWRRRVRLFDGAEEIEPSPYRDAVPFTFAIMGDTLVVDQPTGRGVGARWSLLVVPDSWVSTSVADPHSETFVVPLQTGATDLSGRTLPLPRSLEIAYASAPAASNPSAPVVEQPYYEVATGDISANPRTARKPRLNVDGSPVVLHWVRGRRWWAGTTAIRGFVHDIQNGGVAALSVLMMPSEADEGSYCTSRASRISPVLIDVALNGACSGVLVDRQMFDAGWTATDGSGRTLPHVKVDGFANGFTLFPDTHKVSLLFTPQRWLSVARWVTSVSGILVPLAVAASLMWRRFVSS